MTCTCNAPQNATKNTCGVYQTVAILNVVWNVVVLMLHVANVSTVYYPFLQFFSCKSVKPVHVMLIV